MEQEGVEVDHHRTPHNHQLKPMERGWLICHSLLQRYKSIHLLAEFVSPSAFTDGAVFSHP